MYKTQSIFNFVPSVNRYSQPNHACASSTPNTDYQEEHPCGRQAEPSCGWQAKAEVAAPTTSVGQYKVAAHRQAEPAEGQQEGCLKVIP